MSARQAPVTWTFLALCWLDPTGAALAVAAGFLVGYCQYETVHWLIHRVELARRFPHSRAVRRMLEIHEAHHWKHANRNFGFVTVFWDRVFGTYARTAVEKETRTALGLGRARLESGFW